jgi:hypothetical protein
MIRQRVRFPYLAHYSSLAQLVERPAVNGNVAGPSPAGGAMGIKIIKPEPPKE